MEQLTRDNNSKSNFSDEDRPYSREFQLELEELRKGIQGICSCMSSIGGKIDGLIGVQEKFTRWLLVVVCIIALGRGLIEIGKELLLGKVHVVSERVVN